MRPIIAGLIIGCVVLIASLLTPTSPSYAAPGPSSPAVSLSTTPEIDLPTPPSA